MSESISPSELVLTDDPHVTTEGDGLRSLKNLSGLASRNVGGTR
ncbi:hypothetical protein [Streptomyces sp. H27-D2]|nr:hypothetical protein [Streptomyces sp. H27-D2]MEC4016022.1 hypothetical protein [Streptomyces sp. H27-D2]